MHDDPDASRYGPAADYEPGGASRDWLVELASTEAVPFELLRDVLLETSERDSELDVMLHEGGHAFDLPHVDCTGFRFTSDADPDFPRSDGHIGLDAYDARHDRFLPARYTSDLMSYCMLTAISDFNYRRIYDTLTVR